jgi:hypothetical protein
MFTKNANEFRHEEKYMNIFQSVLPNKKLIQINLTQTLIGSWLDRLAIKFGVKSKFLLATLLFSSGTFAGVCNNGSLIGAYNVELNGVISGHSVHVVGRVNFDGLTFGNFNLIQSQNGAVASLRGTSVMYGVTQGCTATGLINWSNDNYEIFALS